ncbi:MAG: branched-chain amino acid ABC transporter permease [Gammaproteobacteria bacterium]|nr:branched-chain amino acid ABC transporter permease [Gammaproteobacteria bacterium]CAJ2377388.1 MAG: Branched-chain amino acid ABC transporter permease [Arenicellales bacterium IbO2]MDA7969997.1 branched-chain amino acid ABC transporter permease [Gammaproteobacteria bacterium]MDA7970977.1 branched-chain amino acid ABC transporter permease [Gammaproteobacteria bacterium]MDA7994849.1 branched-chain amino acid ABC transporter permease [Gammaproteobacteria bacterium]
MEQILGNLSLLAEFPVINLKIIVDGLMIGSLFALAAYGLALVWGVMNVKNLAQGDFVIAGGYVSWWLAGLGLPPLLGVAAAFAVMWAVGWVVYKLVITRVIERDMFTSLLATFGLAIMMAQILNLLFGSDTQSIQLQYDTLYFFDGFIDVPIAKLLGVLLAALLAAGVILFMKASRMGQAIRATAQDARAARVLGIDTEKVYAFTFSLNAAICGAAGAIIVMVWVIQPFYGISYSIRSFVIVTAAGLGNLPGVIAAGLGIGALEQYGAHIFGIGYQQAVAVLLLLLVLVVRLVQQRRMRRSLQ